MRIALLGATSQIARDLIVSFSASEDNQVHLFARHPDAVSQWLTSVGLEGRYPADDFSSFSTKAFDVIINFVGVGDPAKAKEIGAAIFEITYQYDQLALDYIASHPSCKYIFLSSGAVYGDVFSQPVNAKSHAQIPINNLGATNWYGISKLYAEARHRALPDLSIVDIRVFNYFSHTQDISARFLITDILRAVKNKMVFKTSSENIIRDYLHPFDFYQLVCSLISSPATNDVVDCYSKAPIDKIGLLAAMKQEFGLCYEITKAVDDINATGKKLNYYSQNARAANFGYQPRFTSAEGIKIELEKVL